MGLDLTGLGAIADLGSKIIDKFVPDKAQADAAKLAMFQAQQTGELAQLQADTSLAQAQSSVDGIEAASTRLFVAGWRPWIGWICGTGFGVQFVIGPLAEWGSALAGHPVKFPQMDMSTMMPLLFGILGLGAFRTVEKVKGVA